MAEDIQRAKTYETQCQMGTRTGQCKNERVPGCDYCKYHGGQAFLNGEARERMSNYRLAKWQARLAEKANSSEVISLRDEVGILRILLEEWMQKCVEPTDLLVNSGPIGELAMKIEKTVKSCRQLESSMGLLLDKSVLIQFASEVVKIIDTHITDDTQKLLIAGEIHNLIDRTANKDEISE